VHRTVCVLARAGVCLCARGTILLGPGRVNTSRRNKVLDRFV